MAGNAMFLVCDMINDLVHEDCCCALSEEQHRAVIDQMQRMTILLTAEQVTFGGQTRAVSRRIINR